METPIQTNIEKELEKNKQLEHIEKYKTALKKAQFINEIKNGLGNEIKVNPSKIRFIKKPWHKRLGLFLKKIFTKF
jgi:hypothetical protein